jgi:CRP/FNR family cyclic AMP-dependent transcriptional regulator
MSVDAEQLKGIPFMAGLDRRALSEVASRMRERQLDAGETIVEQGTTGIGFFIILEGEAEVSVDGQPRRTLGPGDHFGEIALVVRDALRSATVTARSPTRVAAMTSWEFKPLTAEHPEMAWALLETLARRVADTPGA